MLVYADSADAGGASPDQVFLCVPSSIAVENSNPSSPKTTAEIENVPDNFCDLWVKCPKCAELIYQPELEHNMRMCSKCGYLHRMSARQRIEMLADADSFQEWDAGLRTANPLGFAEPSGSYDMKIAKTMARSGEQESLVTGRMTISGYGVAITVADFGFMGASMGSVFGEKLARAAERAVERRLPLLTVSASGGARMHEGLFSLMQMAKTTAALARLGEARPAAYLAADRPLLRRRHAPATRRWPTSCWPSRAR